MKDAVCDDPQLTYLGGGEDIEDESVDRLDVSGCRLDDNRIAGVGEYGQGVARWVTMIDPEGNEFDVVAEGT